MPWKENIFVEIEEYASTIIKTTSLFAYVQNHMKGIIVKQVIMIQVVA